MLPVACIFVLFALVASAQGDAAIPSSFLPSFTVNDDRALNYLLQLNYIEVSFFTAYQATYSATDFSFASFDSSLYGYLNDMLAHAKVHVGNMTDALAKRNGTANPACSTYSFSGINSVRDYVTVAASIESTIAAAYTGVLPMLSDRQLRRNASCIGAAKARQASYLNNVLGGDPFPAAQDSPMSPANVSAALASYLTGCTIPLPQPITLLAPAFDAAGGCSCNCNANTNSLTANDNVTLNYLLEIKHLQNQLYTDLLAAYNDADFAAAGAASNVRGRVVTLAAQEKAHRDALKAAIAARNSYAVQPCSYSYGNPPSLAAFLTAARTVANISVQAFCGGIDRLYDKDLQGLVAGILGNEARHAGYVNQITGLSPFPQYSDYFLVPVDVLTALDPYIHGCGTILTPQHVNVAARPVFD